MKTDTKASDKLLNRQLQVVSAAENASFREAGRMLFSLERNLVDQVLNRNVVRKASNEKTCFLDASGNGVGVIGCFEFRPDYLEYILVHESENLTIRLMPDTFLSDAKEVLECIYERRELLTRIAPTVISIGIVSAHQSALAGCIPTTGYIAIYSDRSGGLLVSGLAEATKEDIIPISSRQVFIHELTYLLEQNGESQEKLNPFIDTGNSSLNVSPLTKRKEESTGRDVVKTLPGPDISGIHFEYAGDRIGYKLKSEDRSEG